MPLAFTVKQKSKLDSLIERFGAEAVVIYGARVILSDPKRWTKEAFARAGGRCGDTVPPEDPRADCFCSVGALRRAAYELGLPRHVADMAVEKVREAIPPKCDLKDVVYKNDSAKTRHSHIRGLFDRAWKMVFKKKGAKRPSLDVPPGNPAPSL